MLKHKNLLTLVWVLFLLITTCTSSFAADEIKIPSDTDSKETVEFVYFYLNLCESCTEAKEQINLFIDQIDAANLDVQVNFTTYNLSFYDGPEYDIYIAYLEHYNLVLGESNTPILFAGEASYEGETNITLGLESILEDIMNGSIPNTPILDPKRSKDDSFSQLFDGFSALKILGIGLVNGLNPCSLSMLLLLLSLIMVKDTSIAKLGFTFLLGKFISFIFLGTILYQTLTVLNDTAYLFYTKLAVGVFVILLASLNLYDVYVSRREQYGKIKNQLPTGIRKINHRIIASLTKSENKTWLYISLFILGVVLAISEFLCTGQVYMITINYMIKTTSGLSLLALMYLAIYSFGFIIPPAIIIAVIAKTSALFNVSDFLREKMPYIKLITAFTLIILGLITIFL